MENNCARILKTAPQVSPW